MTELTILHLVVGGALTGLAVHALLNHATLPRLERLGAPARLPRMSVLIPARNEAERIGASVEGWAAQAYPDYEVLVYDDDSSDDTARRAVAAAGGAGHVRVLRGGPLPAGWRGKPWACHRLRAHARGEVLVFADADVRPAPDALARIAGALASLGADAVSFVPAHDGGVAVRALTALQNWAVVAVLPAWLPSTPRRGWLAALNGQLIAVRAGAYDAAGGFAAAPLSLAEDVALGRRLAALGYRVRLVDGARLLRCRPYARLGDLWRANARNLLPVFFGSPPLLLLTLLSAACCYLAPLVLLGLGARPGRAGTWLWTWLPLAEVALGLVPRVISDRRAGYGPWLAALHPVAVGALAVMGIDSVLRYWVGATLEWRDRRYDLAA